MCQGSRAVKKTAPAQQGATYSIGTVSLDGDPGKVGALHALGSTVAACVYCVRSGQKLTLSGIPQRLQDKHGLADSAVVTFDEATRLHRDDVLEFDSGKRIQFREFANCGVRVYVGVAERNLEEAVSGLLKDAVAAASGAPAPRPAGELIQG